MFLIDDSYYLATTRLAAAVALGRAAGLGAEAESRAGVRLTFLDGSKVPYELTGYVTVAVSYGLMSGDSMFRPQSSLSRADLVHAIAMLQKRATTPQ